MTDEDNGAIMNIFQKKKHSFAIHSRNLMHPVVTESMRNYRSSLATRLKALRKIECVIYLLKKILYVYIYLRVVYYLILRVYSFLVVI